MASTDIQTRITAERERLALEEKREVQLTVDRLAPLEAGDDAAVDKIESDINDCRSLQLRIIERIELLTKRLTEEEQAELSAVLDAKEAAANRAREIGEKLIKGEYAKLAKALASTLAKLEAIDGFIADTRNEISRYGRDIQLNDSNCCRHILPRTWTETVTKRVGLGSREHPYYGRAHLPQNNHGQANPEVSIDGEPGKMTNVYVEITVEEERHDSPVWARPLYETCEVSAVEVLSPALWSDSHGHNVSDGEHARRLADRGRILSELGIVGSKE
jgi:hypothetical protein